MNKHRTLAGVVAAFGLVAVLSGCSSPNAPSAAAQKQWEQKPPSTPPPQAIEMMRKAQSQTPPSGQPVGQ